MFYELEVQGHVRVHPSLFNEKTEKAVLLSLNNQFNGFISKDLGFVLAVKEIKDIQEGILIPGDGAAYYNTLFSLITFKPEMKELILGRISDITDFGAFINLGPVDGMIHVSQTMDDYVTFAKTNVLTGKESKKTLKIGDDCRARVVAVSYKDITNPKIGLTMRQQGLGSLKWIEEDIKKAKKAKKGEK